LIVGYYSSLPQGLVEVDWHKVMVCVLAAMKINTIPEIDFFGVIIRAVSGYIS